MRVVLFCHSLLSDWNHGNAHFLRGIVTELVAAGHEVVAYEPEDAWSVQNLVRDHGAAALSLVLDTYPNIEVNRYAKHALDLDAALDGADLVLVHEWNEPEVVAAIGRRRAAGASFRLLFHDTHHRSVTDPTSMGRYNLSAYDGVLAFGAAVKDVYERRGWGSAVWVWHEAADVRVFRPRPDIQPSGDVVWIGNWGDDERTEELSELLFEPVKALEVATLVHGVRYPDAALRSLEANGIEYGGWVANLRVPEVFARHRVTVHVPRRPYVEALPGIPTIRVFEALACGIPLVSGAWNDCEHLFTPGADFLVAKNGAEMQRHLRDLLRDSSARAALARRGRETILARHTCAHRVEELFAIARQLGLRTARVASWNGVRTPPAPAPASSPSAGIRAAPATSRRCPFPAISPSRQPGNAMSLHFVFIGLSITSSWGNGHATTYRALLRDLARRGHRITFLERDVPYYASNRDLPNPPYAVTELYSSFEELDDRFADMVRRADVVVVGSFVPEGDRVGDWALSLAPGRVAFYDIDTPVTLERLERGDAFYLRREQIPRYATYFSFTAGPTLKRLEDVYGSPCARPLLCSVDTELYSPEPRERKWDLGYLGTYSDDRQPGVERLLCEPARRRPSSRFVVAGAQYPDDVAWPANVERITHLPPAEHSAFYNQQRFTLSVTRAAMIAAGWSPSVRLFEASACETPIITDDWPGLDSIFAPGREILVARDARDVARFLFALAEPERVAIGRAARRRVLAEHTSMHRAEALERLTRELLDRHARRRGAALALQPLEG